MKNATQLTAPMSIQLNMTDVDRFYERWMAIHEGLSMKESFELNARLVLLFANQIGDPAVIDQCMDAAVLPESSADEPL